MICTPKVRQFWRCIFLRQKRTKVQKSLVTESKLLVIMDIRKNDLGLRETERKYNIQHLVITKWESIYLKELAEGLMKERRGRACCADGTRKDRAQRLDKNIGEDLIAEN